MATGFKLPDGRDLSDIFTVGDAGINTNYLTSNGTDVGRQFMAGSTGITTGFKNPAGVDLGFLLGYTNDPWIAEGYTKATLTIGVCSWTTGADGAVTNTEYGYFYISNRRYGAISDTSLIGLNDSYKGGQIYARLNSNGYSFYAYSVGTKKTSVVVNNTVFNMGQYYSRQSAIYDYFDKHKSETITIYLK